MQPKELFTDDRAVSPVVGVTLLIAITVILAAVVGGVVLGLGSEPANAPQASITFEYDDGTGDVTAVHEGGDVLPADQITVKTDATGEGVGSDLTAGDSELVASNATSGDTVQLVWEAPNSDKTTTVAEFTV